MANIEEKRQDGRRESDRRSQDRRGTDRRNDSTARIVKFLMGILVLLVAVLFYFFTIG